MPGDTDTAIQTLTRKFILSNMKLNTELMKNWLRGWRRSWTANAGTLIVVLGVIQSNIAAFNLSPHQQGYALIAIGVLMAVLRSKTSKPLSERKPVKDAYS